MKKILHFSKKAGIITSICFMIAQSSAQLPSLNKAKTLVGSKNNNSGTNNNSSTNNTTTTNSNNNSPGNPVTQVKDVAAIINFSNPAGVKTPGYKDGDAIFARVDFTKPMKDIGGKQYNDVFVINLFDGTKFLNGKKLDFLKDEDLSESSFEFQMACSTDQAKSPLAEGFTKTLAQQLGKSDHTIKVKMIRLDKYNNELAVAEGTFELDLSGGKDKLRGQADSYDAKEIAARRMPEAAMKNAAIEKDLMRLIKNDVEEEITPLRAVVGESDWTILRDDYNTITGRTIAGYVAFKVTRNGRCFYKKITIYQPYAGGGKYGLSKYYDTRVSTDFMELQCDNVMK
jgi:hypothetical protein